MRNMKEPAQHGEPSQCSSLQRGFYIFCYWFTWTMLVLTVASFFLCLFQAPDWIVWLENGLRKLLSPSAMAAVAELAGLPGVIFAGLLSRLGDRICGVKMPELIQDEYPHFFRLCFSRFIILSLAAALVGNSDLFWPTLYAFFGVLVTIGWICWVCYVFLIKADSQESLAFRYYKKKLTKSRRYLVGNGLEKDGVSQQDENKDVNWDWEFRQVLLNTAEYARTLLFEKHQNCLRETARIWMAVFSDRSMPEWDENTYFPPNHYIFQDCSLTASAWATLLPNGLSAPHEVKILHCMLDCLDETVSSTDERRYVYNREVLLLGLARFLMETSQRGKEQEVKRLCSLTYGRQEHPADQDLICACLMMWTVEWLEDRTSTGEDIACATYLLQPLLENTLLSVPAYTERPSLAEFLCCAESMIRDALCMKPDDFLRCVQKELENSPETYYLAMRLSKKMWRPDLLSCLLRQIPKLRKDTQAKTSSTEVNPGLAKTPQRGKTTPAAEEASEETTKDLALEEAPGETAKNSAYEEASGKTAEDSSPEEIAKDFISEEIPKETAKNSISEEIPEEIAKDSISEEISAETAKNTVSEEIPAETARDSASEEVPEETLEEAGETPAQAAMGPDETHKKEV